ncbi:MAG: response regulator [Lachnospira sp.]
MNKNILVVDDDAMNLRLATMILKNENYTVVLAKSGEACIDILKKGGIDLVLLDVEMPGMSGIKTLEKIRETDEISQAHVIFVSGTMEDETVAIAEKLGAIDFIKKPFMPQELLSQVARAFG